MPPPIPSERPPRRPQWLAPLVLGLALLTGVGLHFWPDSVPVSPVVVPAPGETAKKPERTTGPALVTKARIYPARNTRVAHSGFCRDCESYYAVHDGWGGKIQRSEGYTTRCCPCGSTVAFSDGYYYEIICSGKHITAKMGKRVSDAD